jgi:hypothetical protein
MPVDRVRQLEELGVLWNVRENQFERGFEALVEFKLEHGHCKYSIYSETTNMLFNKTCLAQSLPLSLLRFAL